MAGKIKIGTFILCLKCYRFWEAVVVQFCAQFSQSWFWNVMSIGFATFANTCALPCWHKLLLWISCSMDPVLPAYLIQEKRRLCNVAEESFTIRGLIDPWLIFFFFEFDRSRFVCRILKSIISICLPIRLRGSSSSQQMDWLKWLIGDGKKMSCLSLEKQLINGRKRYVHMKKNLPGSISQRLRRTQSCPTSSNALRVRGSIVVRSQLIRR